MNRNYRTTSVIVSGLLMWFLVLLNVGLAEELRIFVDCIYGSDARGLASLDSPYKTIGRALEAVTATPATVEVGPGKYSKYTNGEEFPLVLESGITLSGSTTGETLLYQDDAAARLMTIERCRDVTVRNLSCTSFNGKEIWAMQLGGAISASQSQNVCIEGNKFRSSLSIEGAGVQAGSSSLSISNNVFECLEALRGGAMNLAVCEGRISGNTFRACDVYSAYSGGAIDSQASAFDFEDNEFEGCGRSTLFGGGAMRLTVPLKTTILGCRFVGCSALYGGALEIGQVSGDVEVSSCEFVGNAAPSGFGGAIDYAPFNSSTLGMITISDSRFVGNSAPNGVGGAIHSTDGEIQLSNCLFVGNEADCGGALSFWTEKAPSIVGCTFVGNSAKDGVGAIDAFGEWVPVFNSIFRDNGTDCRCASPSFCCIQGAVGGGNIDADPLFVSGPYGDYYLSHIASGQAEDSPCLGVGHQFTVDPFCMGTTRTDGVSDQSCKDIGFHYAYYPHAPYVSISAPEGSYFEGDTMTIRCECENPVREGEYDIYFGLITPNLEVFCMTQDGWTEGINPLAASISLPYGFKVPDSEVLSIPLPSASPPISSPGEYSLVAVVTPPGELSFIHAPSVLNINYVAE